MNLEIKKFDITSIKKDKVCVFIGKRETYNHRSLLRHVAMA